MAGMTLVPGHRHHDSVHLQLPSGFLEADVGQGCAALVPSMPLPQTMRYH